MNVLVTGAAGFIGFHVSKKLLERGDSVVGFDNMNDYYDPALKQARIDLLHQTAQQSAGQFDFIQANLADKTAVDQCFLQHQFDRVIHLAAQAGVRYSLENPMSYVESNIIGFTNIIEACRYAKTPIVTYFNCQPQAYASLRFMDLGGALTWLPSNSLKILLKVKQSKYSIMATIAETLLLFQILSKV